MLFMEEYSDEKNADVNNIQYQFLVIGRIFNGFEFALPLPLVPDLSQDCVCRPRTHLLFSAEIECSLRREVRNN